MKSLVLLGLFISSFSYGNNMASLSESQLVEEPIFANESLSDSEGEHALLNPASILSVKGGLFVMRVEHLFSDRVTSAVKVPVSLEYQNSLTKNKKLKWMASAGGGVTTKKEKPILPFGSVGAGLRYDFQPMTLSFELGADFLDFSIGEMVYNLELGLGWEFLNRARLELKLGYSWIFPFVGLSASFPIKKW